MEEYKLYAKDESYKLYQGKMQDVIDNCIEENSIDCIITDPPYGLTSITDRFGKEGSAPCQEGTDGAFKRLSRGFMGQTWDGSGVEYDIETWKRCLKVLKPGGYLLAFGGTRTFHRIACAIEDAGFEIRDCIMWLYGSGFPKSMNIGLMMDKKEGVQGQRGVGGFNVGGIQEQNNRSAKLYKGSTTDGSKQEEYNDYKSDLAKKWAGWGTQLKPCYEPIIVARKPFSTSLVDNILEYDIGGLNIDECRVAFNGDKWKTQKSGVNSRAYQSEETTTAGGLCEANDKGRFPGNVIHDGSEEVIKGFPNNKGASSQNNFSNGSIYRGQSLQQSSTKLEGHRDWYNDDGSASRYFYTSKASSKDRDEGLEDFEKVNVYENQEWGYGNTEDDNFGDRIANVKRANIHPTVKPTDLMQYLVRLVAPKGATILDCFMGSGSTGKAVMFENRERNANYKFIGIEMTEEYLPICEARIKWAKYKYEYEIKKEEKELKEKNQNILF